MQIEKLFCMVMFWQILKLLLYIMAVKLVMQMIQKSESRVFLWI